MAARRTLSPILKSTTNHFSGNTLRNSADYKFPIQRAPPLSLQQYARSIAVIPGIPQWQHPGVYRPPALHSYLSPQTRRQRPSPAIQPWIYAYRRKYSIPSYTLKNYRDKPSKAAEPIWHPPGPYVAKRPTPLSPEKKREKLVQEPVWHPPGVPHGKTIPYFDPPSLRWSLQELRRTMPDLQTRTCRRCRSASEKTSS